MPIWLLAGAIPGGLSIGPPGKSSLDDSYGRYDLIQNSESPASPPVAVPHSWSRAKSDSDKISNGSSINWPPGNTVQSLAVGLIPLKGCWVGLVSPADARQLWRILASHTLPFWLCLKQSFTQECHGKDCRILILKMILMLLLAVFLLGLP